MTENHTPFQGWCILELMGHRRLGGYITEQEIAGAAFLRIDVPDPPWIDGCTCGSSDPASASHELHASHCFMFRTPGDDQPMDVHASQFYAPSAVYAITPTTEQIARAVAQRSRPAPVHRWELPALEPARVPDIDDLIEDGIDDHEHDDEHDRDDALPF